jgi:hypothetical protein
MRGFKIQYFALAVACAAVCTACESRYAITQIAPAASTSSTHLMTLNEPLASATPNSDICVTNPTAAACNRTSNVTTPGVVTILFTMRDIPQSSGTLILANAIKYASPSANPKILFLKDSNTNGEDADDPAYIKNILLLGYDVTYGEIPVGGLTADRLAGMDLVMVSNPGYPLGASLTMATLQQFAGGVILIGDDMGHGAGFSTDALTGLHYRSNGMDMTCNGHTYSYDNEGGYSYPIAMNSEFMPGIPAMYLNYSYGNDLDMTTAAAGTQVLAWATAASGTCDIGQVPAIVRYPK